MTKKRWVALAAVLAVAVFCLWYTRPRSFGGLTGNEPVVSIAGTGHLPSVENGKPRIETWGMDDRTQDVETLEGLLELVESCQYWVRLRNLLPVRWEPERKAGDPSVTIAAALGESGTGTVFGTYVKSNVEFWVSLPNGREQEILASPMDRELVEKLYAYMKEYGSQP